MIRLEEAYKIVMDSAYLMGLEEIDFLNSLNRVLGEDIHSDMDMPPFDKSAMDGYACKMSDLKNELEVVEVIQAGKFPTKKIGTNQCSQIMTGAPVPEGADCVIMVEHIEKCGENKIRFTKDHTKSNITKRAEDIQEGNLVLEQGTLIMPQHIAVMASVGATKIKVYKQPKIGIISTGDEIVEPNQNPGLSQIRNSNSYQLYAQIQRSGAIPVYLGIAKDNQNATYDLITKGLEICDILLLTGGVSMGEFDFVPAIMEKAGIEIRFQKIAVQPGKPTTFGLKAKKRIFGLPGNPVSSYIQFELLVKPLINRLMGNFEPEKELQLQMGITHKRRKSERMSWFPVQIKDGGKVYPTNYHGSAHIHGMQVANGITYFEIGKTEILEGEKVNVRLI